ncbi:hypothetical protein [Marinovum sp. KMM 9989]
MTLVEMLVVLAILAASIGAVMLAIPGGGGDPTVGREARLLQARLVQAADRSLSSLRPARMRWAADGYVFEEWDGEAWLPHRAPVLGARHSLPDGITLVDAGTVPISPDLMPPRGGATWIELRGNPPVRLRFDGFATVIEAAQ